MSVARNLPLIRERKKAVLAGDPEHIDRQRAAGKLTARERVGLLLDEASFVELDVLAASGRAGVVAGAGTIEGAPVYVYAQDYTIKAGALGRAQAQKILKVMSLAEKTGAPIIALNDSAGARLDEGMEAVAAYAAIMAKSADLSGVVPQISVVLGPCAGGAALCASLSDVVIIGKNGKLFVNGPQLVSAVTGKEIDLEELAGAQASVASGAAHLAAGSDEEALALARKVVSLLPGNNLENAPLAAAQDDINRELTDLNELASAPDMRDLIARVVDHGDFVELSAAYAPEIITALARIGGMTVGFVATQPALDDGRLTVKGCGKAARFVRFLDSFSLPVVSLVDTLGASVACADQGELMRACAQLMYAYAETTSPRVALVAGSAIGSASAALASHAAADMIYAWPGSVLSPITAPVAVQLLHKDALHDAKDPAELRAKLEQEYQANVADGLNAAMAGHIDDVIEPAATRQMIAAALSMLAGKRESKPAKKHGNLPL